MLIGLFHGTICLQRHVGLDLGVEIVNIIEHDKELSPNEQLLIILSQSGLPAFSNHDPQKIRVGPSPLTPPHPPALSTPP
jgi:hypothetical protein